MHLFRGGRARHHRAAETRRPCAAKRARQRPCCWPAASDPEKSVVFVQSHVPAHAQLLLGAELLLPVRRPDAHAPVQGKERKAPRRHQRRPAHLPHPDGGGHPFVSDATSCPSASTRSSTWSWRATLPSASTAYTPPPSPCRTATSRKAGAKVMSLQEPEKKMSKSDTNANAVVRMLDDAGRHPAQVQARRDRFATAACAPAADKPGVTNLMSIYGALTGKSFADIEREFDGRGLRRVQGGRGPDGRRRPAAHPGTNTPACWRTRATWTACWPRALCARAAIARRTLAKVYKKIGFLQL